MTKVDRDVLRKRAHIRLQCKEADTYYGSSDLGFDDKTKAWIKEQLDRGNEWVWCDVKVTAYMHGLESEEYLAQCSYESRQDFMKCDYYKALVDDAIEALAKQFEAIAMDHDLWEHDRITCLPCASVLE